MQHVLLITLILAMIVALAYKELVDKPFIEALLLGMLAFVGMAPLWKPTRQLGKPQIKLSKEGIWLNEVGFQPWGCVVPAIEGTTKILGADDYLYSANYVHLYRRSNPQERVVGAKLTFLDISKEELAASCEGYMWKLEISDSTCYWPHNRRLFGVR
ncbi:hypothetical protein ASU33_16320 [Solirubrum puertoriconensis]|uniref:Uncharacterized protein n=1 Tax=Solirubrum puertoriconensis TaxID=1751427 RepID=A0A9X0HNQ0_SOLP1|nr:hypothetical protein ASU33_16320 [Solirubrum puertoriconensis]